jgi:hypothetical protein
MTGLAIFIARESTRTTSLATGILPRPLLKSEAAVFTLDRPLYRIYTTTCVEPCPYLVSLPHVAGTMSSARSLLVSVSASSHRRFSLVVTAISVYRVPNRVGCRDIRAALRRVHGRGGHGWEIVWVTRR